MNDTRIKAKSLKAPRIAPDKLEAVLVDFNVFCDYYKIPRLKEKTMRALIYDNPEEWIRQIKLTAAQVRSTHDADIHVRIKSQMVVEQMLAEDAADQAAKKKTA